MPVQYLETVVNTGSFKSENSIDDDNEISLTVKSGTVALKFKNEAPGLEVNDTTLNGFFKLPNSEWAILNKGGTLVTQDDLDNMEFKFGKGIESHTSAEGDIVTVAEGVIKWSCPLDYVYNPIPVIQLFKKDGSLVLTASKWENANETNKVYFWITTKEETAEEIKENGSYIFTCFGKTDIAGDNVESHNNPALEYNADIGGVKWVQPLSGKYKNFPIVQVAQAEGLGGIITSADIQYNFKDNQVICIIATEEKPVAAHTYVMTVYGK